MNTTTRKQRKTSATVSAREVRNRLKSAKARNIALKKAGNLPSPTKNWSKDSVRSLKIALGSKKVFAK